MQQVSSFFSLLACSSREEGELNVRWDDDYRNLWLLSFLRVSYSLTPFPRVPFLFAGACLYHVHVNGRCVGVQVGSQRRRTQRVTTTARSTPRGWLGEPAHHRHAFLSVACVPGHGTRGAGTVITWGRGLPSTAASQVGLPLACMACTEGCALH